MTTTLNQHETEERTPIDAYVVALDETANYEIDKADRPFIREIRGVYLFDRNQRTHCCELTPSYLLIHLYDEVIPSEAGYALDDRAVERLYERYECEGGDDRYVHCHTVEGIIAKADRFGVHHYGDTEVDQQDVDHDEQMEALREHFNCNHPF
jgi:hypothetical protein